MQLGISKLFRNAASEWKKMTKVVVQKVCVEAIRNIEIHPEPLQIMQIYTKAHALIDIKRTTYLVRVDVD